MNDDFFSQIDEENIEECINSSIEIETYHYEWLFSIHIICQPEKSIILKRLFMMHIDFYLPKDLYAISVDVEKDKFSYNIKDDMYFVKIKLAGKLLSNVQETLLLFKSMCPLRREIEITSITIFNSKDETELFILYPDDALLFIKSKCSNNLNSTLDNIHSNPIYILYDLCQKFIEPKSTIKSTNNEIIFNDLFIYLDILNKTVSMSIDGYKTFIDKIIESHNYMNIEHFNLQSISLYNIYGQTPTTSEYISNKLSYDDLCYVFDNYHDIIHITLGVSKINNKTDFISRNNNNPLTYDISTFDIKCSPEKKDNYYEDIVEDIKDSNNKHIGQIITKKPIYPSHAMVFIEKLKDILLHSNMTMKLATKTFKINHNTTYISAVISVGYYTDYNNNLYIGSFAFTGLKDIVESSLYRLGVMHNILNNNPNINNTSDIFKINN